VLLGGHGKPGGVSPAAVGLDDESVEQHLAERVGRAVPPGEHAHRPVAVARERRLDDRRLDGDAAE
jgi:hypothetical protein